MYQYLLDNGLTRLEYEFFLHAHLRHHCVMGTDLLRDQRTPGR